MLIEKLKTKNSVALLIGELIKLIVLILFTVFFERGTTLPIITCASFAVSLIMIYEIVFANDAIFGMKVSEQNMFLVFCTEFFLNIAVFFTPLFFSLDFSEMAVGLQVAMFLLILIASSFLAAGISALVFKFFRDLQDYQEVTEPKEKTKRTVKKKKAEPEEKVNPEEIIKNEENIEKE